MFKSQLYTSCMADEGRESKTSSRADIRVDIFIYFMVISNAKVMGHSNLPILRPILSSKFYSISFYNHFWQNLGQNLGPNFAIIHF